MNSRSKRWKEREMFTKRQMTKVGHRFSGTAMSIVADCRAGKTWCDQFMTHLISPGATSRTS